jgi:hypothetical protein
MHQFARLTVGYFGVIMDFVKERSTDRADVGKIDLELIATDKPSGEQNLSNAKFTDRWSQLGTEAFPKFEAHKSLASKLAGEQTHFSTAASKTADVPSIELIDTASKLDKPKRSDIPQLKSDESRLPQVSMVIAATALGLFLTRNAHGAVMLATTSGGAIVGGALAYGYDRYLDSKRTATNLTPSAEDLQKKLLEKR